MQPCQTCLVVGVAPLSWHDVHVRDPSDIVHLLWNMSLRKCTSDRARVATPKEDVDRPGGIFLCGS